MKINIFFDFVHCLFIVSIKINPSRFTAFFIFQPKNNNNKNTKRHEYSRYFPWQQNNRIFFVSVAKFNFDPAKVWNCLPTKQNGRRKWKCLGECAAKLLCFKSMSQIDVEPNTINQKKLKIKEWNQGRKEGFVCVRNERGKTYGKHVSRKIKMIYFQYEYDVSNESVMFHVIFGIDFIFALLNLLALVNWKLQAKNKI